MKKFLYLILTFIYLTPLPAQKGKSNGKIIDTTKIEGSEDIESTGHDERLSGRSSIKKGSNFTASQEENTNPIISGSPLTDSEELLNALNQKKWVSVGHILANYNKNKLGKNYKKDSVWLMTNNKWLYDILIKYKGLTYNIVSVNTEEATPTYVADATAGSIGTTLFDQSAIIDGLATFIAQRFKDELSTAFLERFEETLIKGEKDYYYSQLLPQTYTTLLTYQNLFNFKNYLTTLKQSLKYDLENLPLQIPLYLDTLYTSTCPGIDCSINVPPQQLNITLFAMDFISQLGVDGKKPIDIISEGDYNYLDPKFNTNTITFLTLTSLILESLKISDKLDINSIKKLLKSKNRTLLFYGLLIEKNRAVLDKLQIEKITKGEPIRFGLLEDSIKKIDVGQEDVMYRIRLKDHPSFDLRIKPDSIFSSSVTQSKDSTFFIAVQNQFKTDDSVEELSAYIDKDSIFYLDVIERTNVLDIINNSSNNSVKEDLKNKALADIIKSVTNLIIDVGTIKNDSLKKAKVLYASRSVFTSLISITKDVSLLLEVESVQKYFGYAKRGSEILIYSYERKLGMAFSNTLALLLDIGIKSNNRVYANLQKYGTFMVNIAEAENSAEVNQALQSAALPVGSYRIKRNTLSNISINAFAGFYGGTEFLLELPDNSDVNKSSALVGFTAPIGIAFNWGIRKNVEPGDPQHYYRFMSKNDKLVELSGWSHSIFLPILDLGGLTAFRIQDEDTELLPEVKFQNFLAPGLYYYIGFPKVPLSFGLGSQFGPAVRKFTNEDEDLPNEISSWSIRAVIAVDIPIFNLYSKGERKVK